MVLILICKVIGLKGSSAKTPSIGTVCFAKPNVGFIGSM